jgi:hypothetical protein
MGQGIFIYLKSTILVDFLKENHLRVAATLPWLWACLAIGQRKSHTSCKFLH